MTLLESVSKMIDTATPFRRRAQFVSAPVVEKPKRFPYGAFRFEIALGKGLPFAVQASSDLRQWLTLMEDTAAKPTLEYVDSEAFKFAHRFYRVKAGGVAASVVIGYASASVSPGYTMVANPFAGGPCTVEEVLEGWPDGTCVTRFDPQQFRLRENNLKNGRWSLPGERFVPGEGSILFNPTTDYKSINFVGEVRPGEHSVPVPSGFSIRSSMSPRFGRIREDLGFPIVEGDVIHLFDRDRQNYVIYQFQNGKWDKDPPVVGLCESFWVGKNEGANWRQPVEIGE